MGIARNVEGAAAAGAAAVGGAVTQGASRDVSWTHDAQAVGLVAVVAGDAKPAAQEQARPSSCLCVASL